AGTAPHFTFGGRLDTPRSVRPDWGWGAEPVLGRLAASSSRRTGQSTKSTLGHPDLQLRRTQPPRSVRPEARCPQHQTISGASPVKFPPLRSRLLLVARDGLL